MAGATLTARAVVTELCAALPSVQHVILHDNLGLDRDAIKSISCMGQISEGYSPK